MNIIKHLNKHHAQYNRAIKDAELELVTKVDFEFKILHQQGDGYVILDIDSDGGSLAPLFMCLDTIERKGKLTRSDFNRISI